MTLRLLDRRSRVQPILQGAYAECGLACVAMVLHYHGRQQTLQALRERWKTGLRATSLRHLIEIFAAYDMIGRPKRVELDELALVRCPAIVHWDFAHYVVLTFANKGHLEFIDPSIGRRRVSLKDASPHFTGVVLELDDVGQPTEERGRTKGSTLRRLVPDSSELVRDAVKPITLSVLVNLAALGLPFFLKIAFERVMPSGLKPDLTVLCLLFLLLATGHYLLQLSRVYFVSRLRASITETMSRTLVCSMVSARPSFHESRSASRLASQYQAVQSIAATLVEQLLSNGMDGVFIVLGLVTLATLAPFTALVVGLGLLVFFSAQLATIGRTRSYLAESIQAEMAESGFVLETLDAMTAVKVYAGEAERLASWSNLNQTTSAAQSTFWISQDHSRATQDWISNLSWILAAYAALLSGIAGHMTVGVIAATSSWAAFVLARARDVSRGVLSAGLLRTHLARVEDIVDAQPEVTTRNLAGDLGQTRSGPLPRLEDVWFRYGESTPWILRGCSLSLRPCQLNGIVGPSGMGKTTLLKILLGLLEPTQGRAFINSGEDVAASVGSIRSMSGVVMQNDVLLSGSVLDNITFFDVEPDIDFARECAEHACVLEFLDRLPMRLDAIVGRRGQGFSAGQIQRILLARALYRRPRLLVLDEFSSNLDESCERQVLANLKALDLTILVIAHRPQVIAACDCLLELRGGVLQPPMVKQSLVVSPGINGLAHVS